MSLRLPPPCRAAVAALMFALGCGRVELPPPEDDGGVLGDGSTGDGSGGDAWGGDAAAFALLGAPLIFAPTATGFGLNVEATLRDVVADVAAADPDSIVNIVHDTLPGSAGAPWKFTMSETGYSSYWPDSGYGHVRVDPTSVVVDFVAMSGSVISSYTLQ